MHNEGQVDGLHKILLSTSDAAFRRRPSSDVPIRKTDALLDFGERQSDFCNCTTHSVPIVALRALSPIRTRRIIQHFASAWLDQSSAYIREMHERFLAQSDATAVARTVETVRSFFGFNVVKIPPIFASWVGSVFRAEMRWLEDNRKQGLPSRPPHEWQELAASLAQVFKNEMEVLLRTLPTSPSQKATDFEQFAGRMFQGALDASPTNRVSKSELLSIADRLDRAKYVPATRYLEKSYRNQVAEYNRRVGTSKALTTWRKLASHPIHQRAMRRRLAHAAQKLRLAYARWSAPNS